MRTRMRKEGDKEGERERATPGYKQEMMEE